MMNMCLQQIKSSRDKVQIRCKCLRRTEQTLYLFNGSIEIWKMLTDAIVIQLSKYVRVNGLRWLICETCMYEIHAHSHNKTILCTCRESLSNCGDKYEIFLFSIFRFSDLNIDIICCLHAIIALCRRWHKCLSHVHPLIIIITCIRWWKCISSDFHAQSSNFPLFNVPEPNPSHFIHLLSFSLSITSHAKEHSVGLEHCLRKQNRMEISDIKYIQFAQCKTN